MIYVQDADFTLYQGDVLEGLATLADGSVHCVVTSPPYWGLRDYGTGAWEGGEAGCEHRVEDSGSSTASSRLRLDGRTHIGPYENEKDTRKPYRAVCGRCGARRIDNQLGLEPTPETYVARMVEVFREVRRVLRADGTCWVNMGDSYAQGHGGSSTEGNYTMRKGNRGDFAMVETGGHPERRITAGGDLGKRGGLRNVIPGLKPKDLVGMPWRLAFALQADGWWLRSEIIWAKPNPMPESVTDRPTKSHEQVFLLTKSARYFFDQEAVREAHIDGVGRTGITSHLRDGGNLVRRSLHAHSDYNPAGRNLRSVWEIATQPYPEAHFATFPEELVRRCVLAGTSERGCCPVCGGPWEREVETSRRYIISEGGSHADGTYRVRYSDEPHDVNFRVREGDPKAAGSQTRWRNQTETLGWRPGCACGREDTVPAAVLDPFMGSGTTAFVARKHGRRSVGIELSAEYCELAARRMQQQSLFAAADWGLS